MSGWWTLVVVAIPLFVLWAGALLEVLRRNDLRTRSRVAWLAAIVVLPLLGLAAYLVARPPRALPTSGTGGGDVRALELVVLAERRQRGEITDAEFAARLSR
jgi:hypothetical protein